MEIVMDNGGGCTIVTGKYQHRYADMADARRDATYTATRK